MKKQARNLRAKFAPGSRFTSRTSSDITKEAKTPQSEKYEVKILADLDNKSCKENLRKAKF